MFEQMLNRAERVIENVTAVLFIALLGFTSLNIVLRNLLGVSWLFVDGLLRLMFIWMVFLGTSALYYRNDHLVMDFFQGKMPPRLRGAVILVGRNSVPACHPGADGIRHRGDPRAHGYSLRDLGCAHRLRLRWPSPCAPSSWPCSASTIS